MKMRLIHHGGEMSASTVVGDPCRRWPRRRLGSFKASYIRSLPRGPVAWCNRWKYLNINTEKKQAPGHHRADPGSDCVSANANSLSCIFKYVLRLQGGERQRLQREVEARKSKAHRRSLGLIILFGELFKVEMLKESIMHKCISKLLSRCLEDSSASASTSCCPLVEHIWTQRRPRSEQRSTF